MKPDDFLQNRFIHPLLYHILTRNLVNTVCTHHHVEDGNAIPSANMYYFYDILDLETFTVTEVTFTASQGHWYCAVEHI